jgi:hypothetical protein
MCATETSEALARSVQYALETMCFAEALRAPQAPAEPSKRATVPFLGSLAGCLDIEIGAHAAQALTSALLGLRPGETPAEPYVHDALCELGVVICGRWLSTLDPSACLRLGNGEITGISAESDALSPELRLDFQLEYGHLAVSLRLD